MKNKLDWKLEPLLCAADPEMVLPASPDAIVAWDVHDQVLSPFEELLSPTALSEVPAIADGTMAPVDA